MFQKHSYPLGLIVNVHGARFVDEGADLRNYTYAKYGREIIRQPQRLAFQIFDQAFLLFHRQTGAGTSDASLFYAIYLFDQAFRQFNFGFAAAMAWLLFVIILIVSLIQMQVGNRFVYYESEDAK